jgi:hypothetical protein
MDSNQGGNPVYRDPYAQIVQTEGYLDQCFRCNWPSVGYGGVNP